MALSILACIKQNAHMVIGVADNGCCEGLRRRGYERLEVSELLTHRVSVPWAV